MKKTLKSLQAASKVTYYSMHPFSKPPSSCWGSAEVGFYRARSRTSISRLGKTSQPHTYNPLTVLVNSFSSSLRGKPENREIPLQRWTLRSIIRSVVLLLVSWSGFRVTVGFWSSQGLGFWNGVSLLSLKRKQL